MMLGHFVSSLGVRFVGSHADVPPQQKFVEENHEGGYFILALGSSEQEICPGH